MFRHLHLTFETRLEEHSFSLITRILSFQMLTSATQPLARFCQCKAFQRAHTAIFLDLTLRFASSSSQLSSLFRASPKGWNVRARSKVSQAVPIVDLPQVAT